MIAWHDRTWQNLN